jgi:pullulanase/glycogen debranching enzyme
VGFLINGWIERDGFSDKHKESDIYVIVNSHWEDHVYYLPRLKDKHWYFYCDTAKESPSDIVSIGKEYVLNNQNEYKAKARSVVILLSKHHNLMFSHHK